MTGTLATFADQVTTVAREVGVEGRLGGQANVPGAAGTWKDLTGNVNLLAANLTTQVRAIAEVATAVTQGRPDALDPGRRARRGRRAQGQHQHDDRQPAADDRPQHRAGLAEDEPRAVHRHAAGPARPRARSAGCCSPSWRRSCNAHQGVIYQRRGRRARRELQARRGLRRRRPRTAIPQTLAHRRGLHRPVRRREAAHAARPTLPPDTVPIGSGLFQAVPRNVIVLPGPLRGRGQGGDRARVARRRSPRRTSRSSSSSPRASASCSTASRPRCRPRACSKQSQQLAAELQTQQKELQQTNEQLAQKAQQLAEQNAEVERKNQEIEQARRALEEKATELALTSKYKSEFLANMSHELRTPLNSILILGQQLGDNPEGNLTAEAGRVRAHDPRRRHRPAEPDHRHPRPVEDRVGHGHRRRRGGRASPTCSTCVARHVPPRGREPQPRRSTSTSTPALGRSMVTDSKRLQQVLKNLLSNAFKFTEQGGVRLHVSSGRERLERRTTRCSSTRRSVVAFEVSDTGIGIPPEKQRIIFEAFQQADAGTSRKYGGTGLGLAISRELASLLGGEIQLRSTPGRRQHVHALPAADATSGRRSRGGARPSRRRRAPGAALRRRSRVGARRSRRCPTIARRSQPGDADAARSSRTTRTTRASSSTWRTHQGFKVLVATRGADALALARQYRPTAVSLDVFLPDMLGLDGAEPAQAGPGDAPHPGADRDARRGPPARPRARRVQLPHQADDDRGPRSGARAASRTTRRRGRSGCWSSRTTRPSS